jgi:hypothetical protein
MRTLMDDKMMKSSYLYSVAHVHHTACMQYSATPSAPKRHIALTILHSVRSSLDLFDLPPLLPEGLGLDVSLLSTVVNSLDQLPLLV